MAIQKFEAAVREAIENAVGDGADPDDICEVLRNLAGEEDVDAMVSGACPGCGCEPGDGVTAGCDHPDGCGFFKAVE